ncbi:hypothetical protein GCM10010441_13300 [Kitasatospora paracochleata]|uniref:Secreted protein n=1 Tax=Kitasatospora paracochleata TaxID=58354 RepID=A0ABT1JAU2_9ACTN|nr:hypothetical protein [Kitasatospora paracochleata]MCP2314570.1 hypothetical protein [Kitasatospora paracochleata]
MGIFKHRSGFLGAGLRLLVVAISLLGLTALSAGPSSAAVRPAACPPAYAMPGEHKVQVGSQAAYVYLVYDCSTYSTYAVLDASGLGGSSPWWLAVDIVDQNTDIVGHADTRGYGTEPHARTISISLNHTGGHKMYQARAWFRNAAGCSVFFDSDWWAYSTGDDLGGGWDAHC